MKDKSVLLRFTIYGLMIVATVTILVSCIKEKQYLEVNPTSLNFDWEGGDRQYITISSNDNWNISTSADWFYPPIHGYVIDKKVQIIVKQNTSTSMRSGTLIVSSGSLQKVVNIYQAGLTVLPAPIDVSARQNARSVTIEWNRVSGATGYHVYRSNSANGIYAPINTTSHVTSPTYLQVSDNNPNNGANYYKVKAIRNTIESEYSNYAYCYFN